MFRGEEKACPKNNLKYSKEEIGFANTYDSGKKIIPNPSIKTHKNEIPIGILQEPVLSLSSVPKLMQFATKIPSVINS